jgi:hypothetical protein
MQPDLSLIPVVVATPGVSQMPLDEGVDARWNAWQIRGSIEQRAARQRLQVLVPVLGVCSALALYLFAR